MNDITPKPRKGSLLPAGFQQESERFNSLQEELDQLFNRMTRGFSREGGELTLSPRADLQETDDQLVMTVDLPGFEEKDVDVSLSGDRLTIKGHSESEEEKKEGDYHFSERRVGDVSRMLTLPCEIDPEKVDAKMKNGVLTVTLPKTKASKAQTKKIKVKRAG
jgi:HSP20 family protein